MYDRKREIIAERSIHTYKIGKPIEQRKIGYDVMSVRPYARTHGLRLGTSLPLSLIWSPS